MTIDKCLTCKHAFTTGKDRLYCKKSLADKDDCGEYEMTIKALGQEPSGDLISRQAVLDILLKYTLGESRIAEELRALPSVNPQERTGHWTIDNGSLEALYTEICECSECGMDSIGVSDYCPNCGARMV